MATSFIPADQQYVYGDPFNDLHATFARPVSIMRDAQRVVTVTSLSNNFLFPDAPINSVYAPGGQVSGVFLARIKYPEKQVRDFFYTSRGDAEDQNNLRKQDGLVRIKLDPTGASYIDGAQRIVLDNKLFLLETDDQPHGILSINQFYTFYLKRDQ